jgi:hypothetical protein
MGVASCRSTFLCLMLSVRLVPFRILIRDLIPFSGRARRGFRSAKWLSPARPGPARPWRPHLPHAPSPLSLIWISRATTSPLPLPPLSPRGDLGIGDGDHRKVSSPPLPFSSLSPSPSSSSSPARALPFPCSRALLPSSSAGATAPPRPFHARGCARRPRPPQPAVAPPPPPPARGGAPAPPPARPARPPARPRRGPGAASGPRLGPLHASFWPLAWFAWPRGSPFTASAFPRAQTRARGDYFWLVVNVKLR